MSAPEESATTAAAPERVEWLSEADIQAALAAADWFDRNATPELVAPYRGMHVAVFGERIIDGDRDFDELARRLDALGDGAPVKRTIFRYVRTDEEAMRSRY